MPLTASPVTRWGSVIQQTNMKGKIFDVGTDNDPVLLQAIQSGYVSLSNYQETSIFAPLWSIQALDALRYSCLQATSDDAALGWSPVQTLIGTPTLQITPANVKYFLSK